MTTDNTFNISRRKVLAGLGTVGIASAGAGLGTTAFFSDEEAVGASLRAGRLDLLVDYRATYNPWMSADEVNDRGLLGEGFTARNIPDSDSVLVSEAPPFSYDGDSIVAGSDGPAISDEDWARITREYDACPNPEGYEYVDGEEGIMFSLVDVKPKDEGEATISLHLCDNPAYLWLQGFAENDDDNGVVEPEASAGDDVVGGELDDYIWVEAWYDADCDNRRGDDEVPLYEGSLAGFVALTGDGLALDPTPGVDEGENEPVVTVQETQFDNERTNEYVSEKKNIKCEDVREGLKSAAKIEGIPTSFPQQEVLQADLGTITVTYTSASTADWSLDKTGASVAGGIDAVIVKGGQLGSTVYEYDEANADSGLVTPDNPNDEPADISFIDFCYDVDDDNGGDGGDNGDNGDDDNGGDDNGDHDGACFDPDVHCVAFRWYLPCFPEEFASLPSDVDVDDADGDGEITLADELAAKGLPYEEMDAINVVQTDTVDFGLRFAAMQCRHNMTNANPFAPQ